MILFGQSTEQSLTFTGTPLSWAVSIAAVGLAVVLGLLAWRRSGYSGATAGLETLRVAIVAAVALLLNQPEWVEEYRPDRKPTIAVLVDQSPSMETCDVVADSGDGASGDGSIPPRISRAEAARPLAEPATWQRLGERLDVVIESIGGDRESGTDLASPLLSTATAVESLLGVVLVSDGDWNAGRPPVEAASRLRMRGIPIFTVATGSPTRLPDLELSSLELPTFATAGKPVRVPFTIESSLPRTVTVKVTMKTSTGESLSKDVRIAAMGPTTDAMTFKPTAIGDQTVSIEIPLQDGETIPGNNTKSGPISIREEKLRVLVVESYPRWEYRYLRNALSRDPGIDVSCLLFHPRLEKLGGGSSDYIKAFPGSIEELSRYDVVFLGDVGPDNAGLSSEHCELLKGLVEHQASGLIVLPGWQGRQFRLLETPLAELYPVILDEGQPEGWGSRTPGRFELTESGRRSLLTKLADTRDANARVWEELPGFQWYAPVVRAKAGTEVLAVHGDMANRYGRLPLIVTRTFGAGKVLFMGTDGAWRWRKGVEDKYHYRFWGQVVRWMAYQRNMAKGETMRLYYTPDQPQLGETMALHAHVMDRGGEPLEQADVVARITAPSGDTETVRLLAEDQQWGVFRGRYEPRQPGEHQLKLVCRETAATLETQFFVQGEATEQPGKPARPAVLEELALVSEGRAVRPDQLGEMMNLLAELPLPEPSIRRLQLWSHPVTAGLIVLLLAVFWVWRKVVGLV